MTKIPKRREVNPAFAAAIERQAELRAERQALQAEGRAIAASDLTEGRISRAEELIGGSPAKPGNGGKERLAVVVSKIGDIDTALEMLGSKIATEGSKASTKIREQVSSTNKALVVAICDSLLALHNASKNYNQFADELEADGVLWGGLFPSHPMAIAGHPLDSYSNVALYLRQAAAHGFIPDSKIPQELRA